MAVKYEIGGARLSATLIFMRVKNDWMKSLTFGDNKNNSYDMPLWRSCLIRRMNATSDGEFYIRVFDFFGSKIMSLTIKAGEDGFIGGAEFLAASNDISDLTPAFLDLLMDIGVSLSLITKKEVRDLDPFAACGLSFYGC